MELILIAALMAFFGGLVTIGRRRQPVIDPEYYIRQYGKGSSSALDNQLVTLRSSRTEPVMISFSTGQRVKFRTRSGAMLSAKVVEYRAGQGYAIQLRRHKNAALIYCTANRLTVA